MWFKKLVGFEEINPDQVRENLIIENEYLLSKVNGKRYQYGRLEVPTLRDLRGSVKELDAYNNKIQLSQIVADVQELHKSRPNATFQAASQFNLLEMVNPSVSPEAGVDGYENDHTQGPACAIACGAGTIYRNYLVKVKQQIGQSRQLQIDCLDEIGAFFGNADSNLWQMENGYAFPTKEGLRYITGVIQKMNQEEYEDLKSLLKIGLQINTEVTIDNIGHNVTQAYCSALPIRYTNIDRHEWESFARLILEATYEATFYTALQNYENIGNNELYLTLVGGGVFGNPLAWILDAIGKSIDKFENTPLEVKIVSYGSRNVEVDRFLDGQN